MNTPESTPIGYLNSTDGTRWPVFADGDGQFIIEDDGERLYGVWLLPADEPDGNRKSHYRECLEFLANQATRSGRGVQQREGGNEQAKSP
jgi:hypothetical protein